MGKFQKLTLMTGSALVALSMGMQVTHAEEETAARQETRFEEIIVSATKRPEGIQDVPVSVSAITTETIALVGAVDVSDLALYLPNFEINNSTILPNLYVRGLGSGATHSIEQSVGRFVDEVYIARGAMSIHGFFDIAGVEVLRGPQGTLFGKNTVAGAMIIRTADPTDEFEAGVNLTYGDYSTTGNYQEIQAYASGPLTESFRARLAVRYREDDGYYINRRGSEFGPDGPDREDQGIRLKLEWDASDNTVVSLKLDHQKFLANGTDAGEINAVGGPPFLLTNMQAISPGFNTDLDWIIDMDCTDTFADVNGDGVLDGAPVQSGGENLGSFCPLRDQKTSTIALRVDHDFEGLGTLTSLSAYQEYEFDQRFYGIDGGLANSFRAFRDEEYETFTQELRFTSELINDTFDFIVGVYFESSDISRFQSSDVNFVTLGLGPILLQRNEPWTQETETFAAFAQVRYNVTDDIRLILGGRFSTEEKEFEFDRFYHNYGTDEPLSPGSPLGPFSEPVSVADTRSESKFTPAVTVQYDFSDDLNVYASFSQGHKTGGFSERIDAAGVDFEFDAETNTSYEVGLKGVFLDGSLRANLTFFYMDVEGLQLATQVPGDIPAFSVDNATSITSKGIEFDMVWNLNDFWTVGFDYAYTDATYNDFVGSPECPPEAVVDGQCDLSGFVLNFAPKHKGNGFIEYYNSSAFSGWGFGVRANASFSDEYFTDISYAESSFEDGYGILGGSIRLVSPDENYTISVVGKNLTNQVVLQWGIPTGPNSLASLRAPREIAVKLSARF